MTQPPSASEKEKTARLVESLSRHEQVKLLAEALLREYMHRRGLRETLRTFDAENPRDERTISSRALMRQLLNIPVEGRPSRLQLTASSLAKPQAPTFMEELCSYRLTKRSYRIPDGKQSGKPHCSQEEEEDPSDVELRALHASADAQRAAKALCEQKQREYEELLAAEEAYQQRKEMHKDKKKRKHKGARRHRDKQRVRGDADSSDDGAESESGNSDGSENEEGSALSIGFSHTSRKAKSVSSSKCRMPDESSGGAKEAAVAVGAHWQPPGSAARAGANHNTADDGVSRHSAKRIFGRTADLELDSDDHEVSSDNEKVGLFGLSGASQQVLMARIRAGSEHWPTQAHGGATHAHASSTRNHNSGVSASGNSLSAAPAALSTVAGRDAGGREFGSLRSTRPVGRAAVDFDPNGAYESPSFSGLLSATVPSGVNGGVAALRMKTSPIPIPGLSADGAASGLSNTYSSGFSLARSAAKSASGILVRHRDAPPQRDRGAASDGPIHSYDRTAVPRSSALAGRSDGSNARTALRSSSPNASAMSESTSSGSCHTPSRSFANSMGGAGGSGGGGGSGLRHGIGFRTSSTSAERTALASTSVTGAAALAAGAAKPSRKERCVKLLVD
ncbi:hypothetical protein NXY56_001448 [Leishmania guyanensis]|uniref:MINDY4 N-terminal dimerisation domain-containing protein n=1 Tax=Leishmania guyanensis TaxID=5670 RepID=A0A1E1IR84_LEIGU|nr:hypothetical protein, conserved [Leishmania guyanensis]